jgi:GNAT superfamily N-acetyltransferase
MTSDALAGVQDDDAPRLATGSSGSNAFRVRPARPEDAPALYGLIKELAEYEREPDAVTGSLEDLRAALFNPHPRVHCHVLEVNGPEGPAVAGLALWYVSFSTWRARHGIWLEDLYVQPAYRRGGAGRALLETLADVCVERGYARLEWWVLDWNEPAHGFYRSIGAAPQDEWTVWRLDDSSLRNLAGSST